MIYNAKTVPFTPIPGVLVIGFGHKARSGKDTCAEAIVRQCPHQVTRIAFADALKQFCRIQHQMRAKDADLLQQVGARLRALDEWVFVRAVHWQIRDDMRPKCIVIPDVRYPNEIAWIRALGGVCVKVTRVEPDGQVYVAGDRDPSHHSECALNDYGGWDFEIKATSGDLETLRTRALDIFAQVANGETYGNRSYLGEGLS